MQTNKRFLMKMTATLLLIAAMLFTGLNLTQVSAASLPTSAACSGAGTGAVTCNLWAVSGQISLPAPAPANSVLVKILGYSSVAAGTLAAPGGPVLVANQGDVVTVTLHNSLTEPTSLMFQAQAMIPDASGAAAGSTKSYIFNASNPGTYLYEAGLTPNSQHQVAMGLYGALVVYPSVVSSPAQAYAGSASAYNDEALVMLSEIDPALNNKSAASGGPANFDMRNYHPSYWLINGKPYPATDTIASLPGNRVLLRYINAGIQPHSMSLLGIDQTLIAFDGSPLRSPRTYLAETLAPGQSMDAIVSIPAATIPGTQYALYDASLSQHNNNSAGFGGMLTFINAGTATGVIGLDTTGPATSAVVLTPSRSNGTGSLALSATVSDVVTGNSNITSAEYFIDAAGANGTGSPMSGVFGSPVANVSAVISAAQYGSLASGSHTIYINGQDAAGNWGAFNIATLTLDKAGPVISGLTLPGTPSNGQANLSLTASANDSTTGGSNISAAEYSIDGAAAVAMTVGNNASPISALTGTIPGAAILLLADGPHTVTVRAQDASGNWSTATPSAAITFVVDKSGPAASSLAASPNPNNGATPFTTSVPAVRVTGLFSDTLTNIAAAEGFLDVVGSTGTGFTFIATDGVFNSLSETGYGDIPLAVVATLLQGNHTIYVHARDAAGNWGATSTVTLTIDKVGPLVSGLTLTPAFTNAGAVLVSAAANDTTTGGSNIGAGEYFVDSAGAAGTGIAMTPGAVSANTSISATIPSTTVALLSAGSHTIYVRAKDAAGNWGTTVSAVLVIDRTPPTFSGIAISPSSIPALTASVTLTINGATDGVGGSGVAGGEYWFGTTNVVAGNGTPFSGTTNIPVATGSLAAGSYTLRVRIRDAAGNWSTGTNGVRTTPLTVTAALPDAIFADGFDTTTALPGAWSVRSTGTLTRLNVTTAARLSGLTGNGLQAAGNNTNYVQETFTPSASTYDARFYFNPNGNTSTGQDIFAGATSNGFGTQLFHVRYQMVAGQAQLQIQVGSTANASWFNITNASHVIEVLWKAGTGGSGSLALYVDGVAVQSISHSVNSNVASVRLGSVTSGGSSTLEYFDAFASKRSLSPLLGP